MTEILAQDRWLVAINKSAGLLVHRSGLDPGESRYAVQEVRDQVGAHVYPVHRLDKPTSGVLLFALDEHTARELAGQFSRHEVTKTYIAVVRGHPAVSGEVDQPLSATRRDGGDPGRAPQPALTRYRTLATIELPHEVDRRPTTRYALVELEPLTGRTHQLRRHMKHIAHPIIGDTSWGKGVHNRFFRDHFRCGRLLLHCAALEFRHPATGQRQRACAPLPPDFDRVVHALGWAGALPAEGRVPAA